MKKSDACLIRVFDILLALVLLPFAVIIFALLIIPQLICFGKLFYVSQRTGKNNATFVYVKLKSMYDIPGVSPDYISVAGDGGSRAHLETGRIPPWGRFLRKTHLDEIPEIAFILTGRESFVGPRPLLAEHITLVDTAERRRMKPGWTGLSQVFLKSRGILPSRIQRRLDMRMGRELTLRLYIKILCATLAVSRHRSLNPGPTVIAYRKSIQGKQHETN
ncbi:sugar transferase [Spirochaetia bacterium]|nr:sugar transferase [Spirochaetia bacterium]